MPRYRLEYLHMPTSARLRFTLHTDGLEGAARGAGTAWLQESGVNPVDFAFLSVVELPRRHQWWCGGLDPCACTDGWKEEFDV